MKFELSKEQVEKALLDSKVKEQVIKYLKKCPLEYQMDVAHEWLKESAKKELVAKLVKEYKEALDRVIDDIELEDLVPIHTIIPRVLKDGVYAVIKRGRVASEDEVIAVDGGMVVWRNSSFREVYDLATQEELDRVLEEVSEIRKEQGLE